MNILLIEDETAAARQLQKMILEVDPDCNIMATLESVRDAITWLQEKVPDLIISDIQLADGNSFDIFRELKINIPTIFITAYDEYMQRAFKVNSIDYLLKPIDKDELVAAFHKYKNLHAPGDVALYDKLAGILKNVKAKSRFLVKTGERYFTIPADDIAFLKADDKIVFLYTKAGKKYIIDESLDELEHLLDPAFFFRLNRRYLAPINAICSIHTHLNGRLKIDLTGADDNEIFVSKEKAASFKQWLNS